MDKENKERKDWEGRLPAMAPLANPYVPFQLENPSRYDARKGMVRGTLFPGLDLPFMGMINKEKPATPLTELQALGFAIQELALYLDTHRDDKEALELSFFTSENALKTQQTLLDNIDKVEEFSNNSKDSKGLNSSIDALSKINSAQASALVTLTSQISNLNKLTADTYQNEINEKQLAQKSDELFFASNNEVKSPHLDLEVKLTQ